MTQTVRIVWQYILSWVRVSVRPSIFVWEKHLKPRGNQSASASVYFNGQRPAIVTSGVGRRGWLAQTHRIAIWRLRCVCGGVWTRSCGFVCTHVHACVHPFVHACVMCLQYTIIIFDPGFTQIRHTDDFPSTGTRLVLSNSLSHVLSFAVEAFFLLFGFEHFGVYKKMSPNCKLCGSTQTLLHI